MTRKQKLREVQAVLLSIVMGDSQTMSGSVSMEERMQASEVLLHAIDLECSLTMKQLDEEG